METEKGRDDRWDNDFKNRFNRLISGQNPFIFDESFDYPDIRPTAKELCDNDNTYLPIPRSLEENEWYRWNFHGTSKWLGISGDDWEKTGVWKGDDGTDITWFNWLSRHPTTGGSENFVSLGQGNGEWNNVSKDGRWNTGHTHCVYKI